MSGPDYLLAIDQGTTSTRAILFDASGVVLHTARQELRQIYPRPGWVEHDPEEIWQAVVATCREAVATAGERPIAAIGITNQRETTVLWDRATGRPVHKPIVRQDRRTARICESWRAAGPRDNDGDFGSTDAGLFGDAIPIAGIAGDQQAAAIGQACFRPGMVKSTYGTGAFALIHTGAEPSVSRHRMLTTLAYRLGGETAYALEGSIFIAGAAVQWLRDRLHAVAAAGETQALAERADPRQRVYFVPGFAGLGAPYWAPEARGALSGLTAECRLAAIARGRLDAGVSQ